MWPAELDGFAKVKSESTEQLGLLLPVSFLRWVANWSPLGMCPALSDTRLRRQAPKLRHRKPCPLSPCQGILNPESHFDLHQATVTFQRSHWMVTKGHLTVT